MSCGTQVIGSPEALLRHLGDILATDKDASLLHVIVSLNEGEQR